MPKLHGRWGLPSPPRVKCARCHCRLLLAEAVQHEAGLLCTDCAAEVLRGVTHPPYARSKWTERRGRGRDVHIIPGGAIESNRRRH
jgi:hypothetical protein